MLLEDVCLRMWMCCFTEIYYFVLLKTFQRHILFFPPFKRNISYSLRLDIAERLKLVSSRQFPQYTLNTAFILVHKFRGSCCYIFFSCLCYSYPFGRETVWNQKGHFIIPNCVLHSTSGFTRLFVFSHDAEVTTSKYSGFMKWSRKRA